MGKRYYCDFCDKAFADNAASKKNHFNGSYHQQMKKAHYDTFRDPATILASETAKKPCRRFLQTGLCDYGDGCRFSHLTDDQRRELEKQCQQKNGTSFPSSAGQSSVAVGDVDDWLAKRSAKRQASVSDPSDHKRRRRTLPEYDLPPQLASIPHLPPSLLPPSMDDFINLPLLEWG